MKDVYLTMSNAVRKADGGKVLEEHRTLASTWIDGVGVRKMGWSDGRC